MVSGSDEYDYADYVIHINSVLRCNKDVLDATAFYIYEEIEERYDVIKLATDYEDGLRLIDVALKNYELINGEWTRL